MVFCKPTKGASEAMIMVESIEKILDTTDSVIGDLKKKLGYVLAQAPEMGVSGRSGVTQQPSPLQDKLRDLEYKAEENCRILKDVFERLDI